MVVVRNVGKDPITNRTGSVFRFDHRMVFILLENNLNHKELHSLQIKRDRQCSI